MSGIVNEINRSRINGPVQCGDRWEAVYCFKDDFSGFDGHFAHTPVLPGIIQVQSAFEAIRSVVGEIELIRIQRLKFKGIVKPDSLLKIQWTQKQETIGFTFKCELFVEEDLVGSFKLKAVTAAEGK